MTHTQGGTVPTAAEINANFSTLMAAHKAKEVTATGRRGSGDSTGVTPMPRAMPRVSIRA